MGAVGNAREEVGGDLRSAAGMQFGLGHVLAFGMKREDGLDFVPGLAVNNRRAVVLNGDVAKFEDADVELVGEEGLVGIERFEEGGLFVDLNEGGARGFEFEGLLNRGDEFGIGNPAMGDAGSVVAALANGDRFALEAARGDARDAVIFLNEFAQSALGIGAGLTAFLFVAEIYEEFDDAAVVAFGDGIVDGVNNDLVCAEEGFVVDGVVEVAGEAGVVPQDETCRALFFVAVEIHHAIEVFAADGGAAALGFVHKVVAQDETVCDAVVCDLFELLVGGLLLTHTAAVAAV